MVSPSFRRLVTEHFGYLLADYGFSVAYGIEKPGFGDQVVVLTSGRCGIAFVLDRGTVRITLASGDTPEVLAIGRSLQWFDVPFVVALLTPAMARTELQRFFPPTDWEVPDSVNVDRQLRSLSAETGPYWCRVLALCSSGELNSHADALRQIEMSEGEASIKEMIAKKPEDGDDYTQS